MILNYSACTTYDNDSPLFLLQVNFRVKVFSPFATPYDTTNLIHNQPIHCMMRLFNDHPFNLCKYNIVLQIKHCY